MAVCGCNCVYVCMSVCVGVPECVCVVVYCFLAVWSGRQVRQRLIERQDRLCPDTHNQIWFHLPHSRQGSGRRTQIEGQREGQERSKESEEERASREKKRGRQLGITKSAKEKERNNHRTCLEFHLHFFFGLPFSVLSNFCTVGKSSSTQFPWNGNNSRDSRQDR